MNLKADRAGGTAPLVARLNDTLGSWAAEHVRGMLGALDDALFERAVSASANAEQNRHFETMRELRTRREDFVACALRALERRCTQALDARVARAVPSRAPDAWNSSVRRALGQHEAVLRGLNSLLNAWLGRQVFEHSGASIAGPELFAGALSDACAQLRLSDEHLDMLVEHSAAQVFSELDTLCASCAGMLLEAGVQPHAQRSEHAVEQIGAQELCAVRALLPALPAAAQTTYLVHELFVELSHEPSLAPSVRALLLPLESAMQHAAVADPALLGGTAHPLRRAIADFAALGIGLDEGSTVDEHYRALAAFALELRAAGAVPARLERVAARLAAHVAAALAQVRMTQRRSEEAERTRVLVASVRATIERVIAAELGSLRLPVCAEELLREGWQRTLVHAWLAGGREGAPWQEAARGLERFVALWRHGAAGLPEELEDTLREGMLAAGCDPLRGEILLRGVSEELASWDAPPPLPALMQVEGDDAAETPDDARALAAVDALSADSWMLFRTTTGTARTRLAARCGEPESLLFVDRHGRRACGLAREELTRRIANGDAQPILGGDPFALALRRLRTRLERRRH